MKKIRFVIMLACVFACVVYGKRKMPVLAEPVVYQGIQYSAPQEENELLKNGNNLGIIKATDITNQKEIWIKRIYLIKINKEIEQDVQMVYINNMKIDSVNKLIIIRNEKGNIYKLDLKTKECYQVIEKGKE
jgi:hypothetical protein